ncbi:MAG: DUF6067 family protein [Gemmataceae bacterium]
MTRLQCLALSLLAFFCGSGAPAGDKWIIDPSFEVPKEKDRFGRVFKHWSGWLYEGECGFRVSDVAHTGKHSLLMVGGSGAKIRAWPEPIPQLPAGRYRVTAYLRGLDIGTGSYGHTTEFMFSGDYMQLKKNGTFGWTKMTYVGEVKDDKKWAHPSFGLTAPGYLWVDDVTLERVGPEVALTPRPLFGAEETEIAPPRRLGADVVRCPECGYRNNASWGNCYACGTSLERRKKEAGPALKVITSFEEKNPFPAGTVVEEHATDGKKSLRIDKGFVSMDAPQSWLGYDYLKADVYTDSKKPLELSVEIRDKQTHDYWTRVNYNTVVPPGKSTLIIPTALYVGEKSRPGRALMLDAITRLVLSIGDKPGAPLFVDNLRLERDTETEKARFDGLWAFDVGPAGSPVMEGFTPLDVTKVYSVGRGYGWKKANFWRGFDALQPDPLYRDFLCIEKGGLAIDVPDGKYHVFVNMDSPSGYWGEFQRYRKRALIVEGTRYEDTMDRESFRKRYFRFYDHEDFPSDNTFDTYQKPYFSEKLVTAEVRDGQLNIEFEGQDWACCVSAIIVFPDTKAEEGKKFLEFVRERRRFHFDNAFKRVLPEATGSVDDVTEKDKERGFILFARDFMKDVNLHDRPEKDERVKLLTASAFQGEMAPVALSIVPLEDLGEVKLTVGDLVNEADGATLASSHIRKEHVQYRIARVTEEGSVYTIKPKLLIPDSHVTTPVGIARTFWITVNVPKDQKPGVYRGNVRLTHKGKSASILLEFTVRKGTLDAVDIPVGPWGHTINLPWYDEEAERWNNAMTYRCLKKLKEYGFTTTTGAPLVRFKGMKGGIPVFDFTKADEQMRILRECGFTAPIVSYCPFEGLNLYHKDEGKMRECGFTDYSAFVKAVFGGIQAHAKDANWLPVYWNLADEPLGDDLKRSAENAEAFRKAFPEGPPYFTGASSFTGDDPKNPHFRLSKALHAANWNSHDEASVKLLREAGSEWGFYNGANRWTYGVYLYKAGKEYGMKFRVAWHWNNVAGDPYYALDCREDDFAWCTATPDGDLIPAVIFERLREGLGDYRRMLTLARLAREKKGTPAAAAGEKILADILGSFRLGQRDLTGVGSWRELRGRLEEGIEALR